MLWDALLSALGLAGLTVVVLWAVLEEGPVTAHRIRGAVASLPSPCGFLRICLWPHRVRVSGFFTFSGGLAGGKGRTTLQGCLYFSVVTITTLGYGDITPIHPWARSAVMLGAGSLGRSIWRFSWHGSYRSGSRPGSHGLLMTGQIGKGRTLPTISPGSCTCRTMGSHMQNSYKMAYNNAQSGAMWRMLRSRDVR